MGDEIYAETNASHLYYQSKKVQWSEQKLESIYVVRRINGAKELTGSDVHKLGTFNEKVSNESSSQNQG